MVHGLTRVDSEPTHFSSEIRVLFVTNVVFNAFLHMKPHNFVVEGKLGGVCYVAGTSRMDAAWVESPDALSLAVKRVCVARLESVLVL